MAEAGGGDGSVDGHGLPPQERRGLHCQSRGGAAAGPPTSQDCGSGRDRPGLLQAVSGCLGCQTL